MWEEFVYIPVDFNDKIKADFYWWEKATYHFDIWHWFDEKLPNGVYEYVI